MRKNLKKLLSEQSSQILPDGRVKENIKNELGFEHKEGERAYAHGGTESVRGRRAMLIAVCAFATALVLCLSILLPALFRGGNVNLPAAGGKFGQIETTEDFYAYGAASVGSLLSSKEGTAAKTMSLRRPDEEQMKAVERYMSLVDGLLSDGKIEHTAKAVSGSEYAFEMTVRYKDLAGSTVSYEMYYNRRYIDGEKDGDETEAEYSIEGILIVNGISYPVEGTLETEEDEDEKESELTFRAYTSDDAGSYIEVRQETEEESKGNKTEQEQFYVYTVYERGAFVERTTVEYESKDGVLELFMVLEYADGRKDELLFEQKKGNRLELNVYADMDGERWEFVVKIKTGEDGSVYYEYSFDK